MDVKKIFDEISKKINITEDEFMAKVKKKCEKFSGLITEEGAAYLVAKELGIDTFEAENKRRLQIKNIVPGMKNLNFVGRIIKITPVNEFKTSDGKGKVANLYIADETDYIRVTLWNDQVKIVEDGLIKVGDVVQVINGISRENIFGEPEISLGKYGTIKAISFDLPPLEQLPKILSYPRTSINKLKEGNFEIRAHIVHVFNGNFLFEVCPQCENALQNGFCATHGNVEPKPCLVISCILDDGTGIIRAVFFREVAEKLITANSSEISRLEKEKRYEFINGKIIGKEMIFLGSIKINKISNKFEMVVKDIKDLNVLEESKKIFKKMGVEW